MARIPKDFPVRPIIIGTKRAASARNLATCGTCGRSWDDGIATSYTPAPNGRCPFEYFHGAAPSRRARVTRDEWQVWGNAGYGWDEYCAESTRRDGLQRLREYRENATGFFELRKRRVRLEATP